MIEPPLIFVYRPTGEVEIAESIDSAYLMVEPPEVAAGLYRAFDSRGRLLELTYLEGRGCSLWFWPAELCRGIWFEITPSESSPSHYEEARQSIIDYLERLPNQSAMAEVELATCDLEALIRILKRQ